MKNTEREFESQQEIPGNAEARPGHREGGRGRSRNGKIPTVSFFPGAFLVEKLAFDLGQDTGNLTGSAQGRSDTLLDNSYKQPYTEAFEDRLQAKTARKRRSLVLAGRIEKFDPVRGQRMRNCNRRYSVAVSKCIHRYTVGLKSGVSFNCEDRLCPECSRKRSARLVRKLSGPLAKLQERRGLTASFVTLTLKNSDELPSFSDLTRWKKRLLRSKFWQEFGLYGTVGSLEVKLGENSGQWHCHFHVLAFTQRPVPLILTGPEVGKWQVSVNQELSEAWMKANDGHGFIVRGVGFDGDFREILKYIGKGIEDMDDDRLEEFCGWSHGRRFLFLTGGLYANKELQELIAEENNSREVEESYHCPHCQCTDFEREDRVFYPHLNNYVIERTSDFSFDHTE